MWPLLVTCAVLSAPPPSGDWVSGPHGIAAVDALLGKGLEGDRFDTVLSGRARYGFEVAQLRLSFGADLAGARQWFGVGENGWSDLALSLAAPQIVTSDDGRLSLSVSVGETVPLHDLDRSRLAELTALARGEVHAATWRGGFSVIVQKSFFADDTFEFDSDSAAVVRVATEAQFEKWVTDPLSFGFVARVNVAPYSPPGFPDAPSRFGAGQSDSAQSGRLAWAGGGQVQATWRMHPLVGATAYAHAELRFFDPSSSPQPPMELAAGLSLFVRTDAAVEPLWLLPAMLRRPLVRSGCIGPELTSFSQCTQWNGFRRFGS